MNANSFWGTIDQLLGREAQKQSGQDSLKVAGWLSAYAGVRKTTPQGDDTAGYGSDGFSGLPGRTASLPSIFPTGNQLIHSDQDGFNGDLGPTGNATTGGGSGERNGGGRKKVRFRKAKLQQLYDVEVLPVEYMGPKIEYSVNLPRVTAQLEKLMGTNVVRLTDRKYMQELQRRIQEDYNVTLEKRISEREHREWQRQKQLILDGKYSLENCPRPLVPLHSIVLAKEIERERNLILSGAGDSIPEEMTSSVFLVNQKTNVHILNKREKLKTIREKNAERLIKQGHRWERERLQMEEQSREREIEQRTKREALLEQEKLYMIEENDRSLNLLRTRTKKGPSRDMNLRSLLMQQREELGRTIQKRDFDLQDDRGTGSGSCGEHDGRSDRRGRGAGGRRGTRKQHRLVQRQQEVNEYQESSSPEEGYISMNNADSPEGLETTIAIKVAKGASRDSGDESEGDQEPGGGQVVEEEEEADEEEERQQPGTTEQKQPLQDDPSEVLQELELSEAEREAAEEARLREELDRTLMEKKKARQVRNEDPKITKLKDADTVADIYNVADEIIILEKKKTKKAFGK